MTLKDFADMQRVKVIEWAQSRPEDWDWKVSDAWSAFDWSLGQMFVVELPKSIELDPE